MQEIMRDPLWQFVGIILAIIAIIVTIILFLVQRKKKALEYEIISQTPILSTAEEIAGQLQILFGGEPVQGVYLFVIKLLNAGNVPIVSSDYERQVRLNFGEDARVLTAEVSDVEPTGLEIEITIQDSFILLNPVLLNSGDVIVVKALVSNYKDQFTVDGRIVGVKSITPQKDTSDKWGLIFMFVGTILLIGSIYLERQNIIKRSKFMFENPIANIMLVIGYFFLIASLFTRKYYKKRVKRALEILNARLFG